MSRHLLSSLVLLFLLPRLGHAQTASNNLGVGFPENGAFQGSDVESVQVNNGNLHVQIPLWKYPGRGLPATSFLVYNSKGFQNNESCDVNFNCTFSIAPEVGNSMQLAVASSVDYTISRMIVFQHCTGVAGNAPLWTNTTLREPDGTKHHFVPDPAGQTATTCWPSLATLYSDDASGWVLQSSGSLALDRSGIEYRRLKDTNGNFLNWVWNSPTFTDTLGRTVNRDGSYFDSTGTLRQLQITYTSVNVATHLCIPGSICTEYTGTWTVPSSITLPDGLSYSFEYAQNQDGEITAINLPTGGRIEYTWVQGPPSDTAGRRVATRKVIVGSQSSTWTYSYSNLVAGNYTATVTDPLSNQTIYTCTPMAGGLSLTPPPDPPCQITRVESHKPDGTLLKTVQTAYSTAGAVLPISETVTLNDVSPALTSRRETDYDSQVITLLDNGIPPPAQAPFSWRNPIEIREYGFDGLLARRTHFNYLHLANAAYLNANIADRPVSKVVYDGAGNIAAQTTYAYDESLTSSTASMPAPNHDYTAYSSSFNLRGNLTTLSQWRNTDGVWLRTTFTYDDLGNRLTVTDPGDNAGNRHATTFSYTDSWSGSGCVPAGAQTYAFATQTTNALGHRRQNSFYPCTGLLQSTRDENDVRAARSGTTFSYDLMNRAVQTNLPDGGQKSLCYSDTLGSSCYSTALPFTRNASTLIAGPTALTTAKVLDGFGRLVQSRLTSDPQGTVYTDTTYDALGRVATVSNPYRTANDPGPTNGISTTQYDALGRVTKVIPPDGNVTTGANSVNTSYVGNCTTVTDQAGKARKSCADAFGRLTQVFEDPAGSNFETDYTYDVLGNLLTVNQKGGSTSSANWRTRTFTYDSLSRLLTATNPESGTITYSYDPDGNLLTKTAPAPNQTGAATVTTTYAYDALHRITQKSFSDTTPTVKYGYDAVAPTGCTPPTLAITNGIGRRTAMCDAAGAEAWSYDTMGRPLADQRTTSGVTKGTAYTYNLDGSLATLTYPSGRTITYTPNAAGRTVSAVDATGPINYATNAAYAPQGALASVQNGGSLYSTFLFNKRLQPCWLYATTTSVGAPTSCTQTGVVNAAILDYQYDFGLGVADNGNVNNITNRRDPTRSQSFMYDSLNRLGTAQTQTTGVTIPNPNCWGLTFGYDPWGNLLSSSASGPAGCGEPLPLNVTATTSNQISGYCYDAAGNLLDQGACPATGSHSYAYNAENQLTATAGLTYVYDGDGKRVQKSTGKLYWYGMGSDPLDETDLSGSTTNGSFNEYVFFNGKRIARRDFSNNVNYFFADHLGTTRVVTNAGGTILDDSDFYPFGGERPVLSSSGNTYKFTGKERDSESGLDNFGARYNSSSMGRFMSPDPVLVSWRRMVNPQIWNAYSYAGNNPLRYVDPNGEELVQLGEHTDDEIKKRTKEINQQLKDKSLTKEQKDALKKEKNTLALEKEGNRVVGNLLAALDKTGERNGLTLKNFTLSTDTRNDFSGKLTAQEIDRVSKDQAFVIQNDPQLGGTIYIRSEPQNGFYQLSQSNSDFTYYGASALSHEQVHLGGFRENLAYQRQLSVFEGFKNFFQSQTLYGDLDAQIKKALDDNKNN